MKTNLILLTIFFLMIIGCSEDDSSEIPANTLEAKVVSEYQGEILTGETLVLDGSKSKDKAGKPFQYLWKIKAKPNGSLTELEEEVTAKPKFTPDKAGNYSVELKIFNSEFYDTDELAILVKDRENPPLQETIIISENITERLHLANVFEDPGKFDYLVTSDIHVTALLTIDPNVVIAFEQNTAMYIDNPGAIITTPAASSFITFTGKNKVPGYWKGLIINSNSPLNKLDRVTIEYGGGAIAHGMEVATGLGIANEGPGHLNLVSSIIQYSAAFAMAVEVGAKWNTESFNAYRNNKKIMRIPASQFGVVSSLSEFQNNEEDNIEIIGDQIDDTEETVWSDFYNGSGLSLDAKYIVKGKVEVISGLRILGGLELYMDKDSEINITKRGYLIALGSPQDPIKFLGNESVSGGYWKGISIMSNDMKNELDNVEIHNAGSEIMDGLQYKTAVGLGGANEAKLKLFSSKIVGSGGNGIYLENGAELVHIDQIRFHENQGPAITMAANQVKKLNNATGMEFIGNGHNGVEILGSTLFSPDGSETVWPSLHFGASYLVSGNLGIQSGLKILPGAVFKFAEDKMLGVFPNGYLIAKGTDTNKIVFTGANASKGFWNGIRIQSDNIKNLLDQTEVLYAGKSEMPGVGKIASIGLDGDYLANLTIINSKIAHGHGYGIALEDNRTSLNSDYDIVNIFEDLSLGNVSLP
ncbi:hypothetical protein MWU78_15735 [Arenibacter sp. F26102]|uniref:right-handed parallel beta-helix repeat-containing protein n=1 Tax=Arenibacter sp. F26102 TaxID=2926416 RepID=UPI001FF345AD|nr:right-handed parallel beta-helix repeat-containing protein [Arenibacter sp. F26102]MCK0147108.1 hypothetical protein [Arenibacter sp. F26102]